MAVVLAFCLGVCSLLLDVMIVLLLLCGVALGDIGGEGLLEIFQPQQRLLNLSSFCVCILCIQDVIRAAILLPSHFILYYFLLLFYGGKHAKHAGSS